MLEKADTEFSSLFADAGIDSLMDKMNEAIKEAGHDFRVESVTFTNEETSNKCRCTRRGVTGYTERCVTEKWGQSTILSNIRGSCVLTPVFA